MAVPGTGGIPGFSSGQQIPGLPRQRGFVQPPASPPASAGDNLANMADDILAIKNRLVPPPYNQPCKFKSLANGKTETFPCSGIVINGIIATIQSGIIAVYLNTQVADISAQPPDFIFSADSTGSEYIPYPITPLTLVTIVSTDPASDASGQVKMICY